MKIRSGFVSNSSSSSFVCSVCNTVETGYDGEYDFPTTYCRRGHHFCSKHLDYLDKLSIEEKKDLVLNIKNDSKIVASCSLLNFYESFYQSLRKEMEVA